MRRINGLPLTTITGIADNDDAVYYLKEVGVSVEPNIQQLRNTRTKQNKNFSLKVNRPQTTSHKYLLARTAIVATAAANFASAIVNGAPGSPLRSLGIAGIGTANGYIHSAKRWHKRKVRFEEELQERKDSLKASLEGISLPEFQKATLILGLKDVANGIEVRNDTNNFNKELQKFDESVDLICALAKKTSDPQELEKTIKGLENCISIVNECIRNLKEDIEFLDDTPDKSRAEAKYERNAIAFLPHARSAYQKLNESRNQAANIANGITPTHAIDWEYRL